MGKKRIFSRSFTIEAQKIITVHRRKQAVAILISAALEEQKNHREVLNRNADRWSRTDYYNIYCSIRLESE